MNESEQHAQHAEWEECPGGEIATMLHRKKQLRRRRFLLQVTAASVAGVLAGVVFVEFRLARQETRVYHFGNISCTEVQQHAKDYMNPSSDLPDELRSRIRRHLAQCPQCRKRLQPPSGSGRDAVHNEPAAVPAAAFPRLR